MYTYSAKRRSEISEPVSVVQQGVSVSLSVDVKEINLAEAGKEQTFNITCNTSWSISGCLNG